MGPQKYLQSEPKKVPDTFNKFQELPAELRLKIWNLSIRPRILHHNHSAARRSKLQLDPLIPALLHVCQESRAEGLKVYSLKPLDRRIVYIHQELDVLLWIRGPRNGPRTFRIDAEKLDSRPAIPQIRHLAISEKFWNRITTLPAYENLYGKIRTSPELKVLIIVHDEYGNMKWSELQDAELELVSTKHGTGATVCDLKRGVWKMRPMESLWQKWDCGRVYPGMSSPEIKFAKLAFRAKH